MFPAKLASVFWRAGGISPARPLFLIAIFPLRLASQAFNSPMEKDPEPGMGAGSIATEYPELVRDPGRSRSVGRGGNRSGRTANPSGRTASRSGRTASRSARIGVYRKG